MAITINGVVCQERVAKLSEGNSFANGPVAMKGFYCAWSSRFTVIQGLLGLNTRTTVGSNFASFSIATPAQYPEITNAYCQEVSVEPHGPPTQGSAQVQYTNCTVWASYKRLPFAFSSADSGFLQNQLDPNTPLLYCKQSIQVASEYITVPGNQLKFAGTGSSGKTITRDYAFPIAKIDMRLQFMRVPFMPLQAFVTAENSPVNSATFLGFATGYVIFNGCDSETTTSSDGTLCQNLNESFTWRAVPWTYDWDPTAGQFSQVVSAVTSNPLISSSDLNNLIPTSYLA